jgi:hypothetical protein
MRHSSAPGTDVIVTQNLRDCPDEALVRYDIEAQHPDEFVQNQPLSPALGCLLSPGPDMVRERSVR